MALKDNTDTLQEILEEVNNLPDRPVDVADCDMLIQMEHYLHGSGLEENITKEDFTILKGNVSDVMSKWKNKEVVKICLLARWYYEDDGWHYDLYEATAINMYLDDNETYGYYLEAKFECGGNSVLLDLRSETNSVENVYVRCREIVTTKPYDYKEGQVAISDGNGGVTWTDLPTGGSDWDMVIECDGYAITDISNLTVIKGNALDVYNKCKNGENPKAVLWHHFTSDDEIENVMPTTKIRITYWEEDYGNLYLTFTSDDGHYKTTYYINFSSDGLSTSTIDGAYEDFVNLEDVIHLPRTEDNWPDNGTAGQFAVSDGKGGITWLTVNNGNEVAY